MSKKRHPKKNHLKMTSIPTSGTAPAANRKGIYSEYIDKRLDPAGINAERKKQLSRISALRGDRAVLVLAADLNKAGRAPVAITYSDLVPFRDQLGVLDGDKIDLIIETPGGLGEVAEDMVKLLRGRFSEIGVIIPGYAKSAGTLLAMAGDEILMEPASALGPIDAQIVNQGKQFSAEAFITGLDKIKDEVQQSGQLNKAYIPILQAISPGEIQNAQNALKFAKVLVTDWLAQYKFRNWKTHSSTGHAVTQQDRLDRASEIANRLADHSSWLTHGRSIKIDDLRAMRLLITDYSETPELADAIRRYFILLQMTFAGPTGVYKVFETPASQIFSFARGPIQQQPIVGPVGGAGQPLNIGDSAKLVLECPTCNGKTQIQMNLKPGVPLTPGAVAFPPNNKVKCSHCSFVFDVTPVRQQVEAQTGKKVV